MDSTEDNFPYVPRMACGLTEESPSNELVPLLNSKLVLCFMVRRVRSSTAKRDTSIYYSTCSAHTFYFRKTNNSCICTDSGMEPADSRHFPGSLLFFNSLCEEVFSFFGYTFSLHWENTLLSPCCS